ncbi:hypothetical protein OAF23_03715 [Flavobacteriaceae bacterium]|nr:hypothetical protein [Flavobacteriaceae bacterium]MDB4715203.1 hypothetical protein [Flavobacteriaceae bacterium]
MKILVITYYFSPSSIIGAKRWTDFYNISKENKDLVLTILTSNSKGEKLLTENINYIGDEHSFRGSNSLNKKTNSFDLFRHPSLLIRSLDRSMFLSWIKECKKWINTNSHNKYDLIISSYGPIASIIVGNYAKKVLKAPYILDLRDLISIQGQKKRLPIIHQIDKLLDRFLTRKVDKFLTVSPKCFSKAKTFYKKDVSLIYNGFTNKLNLKNNDLTIKNKHLLKILYMGTLGKDRNPLKIINILNEYAQKNPLMKISLSFASKENPLEFLKYSDYSNIKINSLGYLTKKELALEKEKNNIFLLLEDQTSKGDENLTGKIYEYFEEEKPILVSCSQTSDIGKVIKATKTGSIVSSIDDLELFIHSKRIRNNDECLKYARANQYVELKKVLDSLLHNPT